MLRAGRGRRGARRETACRWTSSSVTNPAASQGARPEAGNAGGKSGQDTFDFEYGDGLRRAHRAVSTQTSRRSSPLQTRRRRRANAEPAREARAPRRLAARHNDRKFLSSCSCRRARPAGVRREVDVERYARGAAPGADGSRAIAESRTTHRRWTSGESRASTSRSDCEVCGPGTVEDRDARKWFACCSAGRRRREWLDHWLSQAAPVEGLQSACHRTVDLGGALKGFAVRGRAAPRRPHSRSHKYLRFIRCTGARGARARRQRRSAHASAP